MPSKKKKYNARFPAGRIKKIMQTDEEVGKVAQAVPVIISRTLELFVGSLLTKAMQITSARNAKTLSPSHMKQCILSDQRFDFLKDLVKTVQDTTNGEDDLMGAVTSGLLPPGPNQSAPERRKSSSSSVIKEEIKTEKSDIKEEPVLNDPHPLIVANCSSLHLSPNFYSETRSEPKGSIHQPPIVPGYQDTSRTSSPGSQDSGRVNSPSLGYQDPSRITPSPILVMDEDYDT